MKAKLEVKNLPLAERTWKLKNHTTLNLSLDNVGSHITTNMQQNAAFSNQLEERSPTWPASIVTASWQVGNETGMVGNDGFMVARCHFHFLAEFSLLNPQADLIYRTILNL